MRALLIDIEKDPETGRKSYILFSLKSELFQKSLKEGLIIRIITTREQAVELVGEEIVSVFENKTQVWGFISIKEARANGARI